MTGLIVELALRHDGRPVGAFIRGGDGRIVLRKRVAPERHMLRKPSGWGVAEAHLRRLAELGGGDVELISDSGHCWRAPIEAFFRHGLKIRRDVDVQIALPLTYWRCDGPEGRQLELF